jgi:GDP-L-fucose synthase
MKQKILICGGNGFIGRNLINHFSQNKNYEVCATWHKNALVTEENIPNVNWIRADLTLKEDVQKAVKGVDIILQYAAVTTGVKDVINKPYIHVTDNAIMNSLLLREAFEQKVKHFIFPSCTVMYQSSDVPVKEIDFNESDELNSKYYGGGSTKVYIEKMCKFYSKLGETKFTALRQSNIYGPYDKFDLETGHVLCASVVKVMEAENQVIVWGTGEEEKDLLHVSDLVNCIESAIDKQKSSYELINVGSGKFISVTDLVKKIIEISGKKLVMNYDETKPTIKSKLAVDTSKVGELFGWSPKVSFEDGIKSTIQWYKENSK